MKTINIPILSEGDKIVNTPDTVSRLRIGELVSINIKEATILSRVTKATEGCIGCCIFDITEEDKRSYICPVRIDGRLACCDNEQGMMIFSSLDSILEDL